MPVTDGKYFYIVNDRGIVWCLDAKTGEEIYGRQRIRPGTYSALSGPGGWEDLHHERGWSNDGV